MGLWLKACHILAILIWAGPVLGAWWFYIQARRAKNFEILYWTTVKMHQVLVVEHIGFLLVIITGIAQLLYYGWVPQNGSWLWYKLVLFIAIVLPFECLDSWLSHHILRRTLAEAPQNKDDFYQALKKHDKWMSRLGPPVTLVILFILILSITKFIN